MQPLPAPVGRGERLTVVEAARLGEAIRAGRRAEASEASGDRRERDERERTIARGREARRRLIVSNLGLAYQVARMYASAGRDMADSLGDALVGLVLAADRWEPGRGTQFSTAARYSIRGEVLRARDRQTAGLPCPSWAIELAQTVSRRGIGTVGDRSEDEVREIVEAVGRARAIPSRLEFEPEDRGGEEEERRAQVEHVREAVGRLRPADREVITLRWGLDGRGARSQDAVARLRRCSRARIKEIEARVIEELRTILIA